MVRLRKQCCAKNAAIAECARADYGMHFNEVFRYLKGGKDMVMVKAQAIVERYMELTRVG
jgi:hypothetical protein